MLITQPFLIWIFKWWIANFCPNSLFESKLSIKNLHLYTRNLYIYLYTRVIESNVASVYAGLSPKGSVLISCYFKRLWIITTCSHICPGQYSLLMLSNWVQLKLVSSTYYFTDYFYMVEHILCMYTLQISFASDTIII